MNNDLNKFSNLQVLESDSAQGLANMLSQVKFMVSIVSMYADNGKHYAYVDSTHRIKIKQENKNVISRQED